jgi:hypothetical protein
VATGEEGTEADEEKRVEGVDAAMAKEAILSSEGIVG